MVKTALLVATILISAIGASAEGQTFTNNFSFIDDTTKAEVSGTISGITNATNGIASGWTINVTQSPYQDLNQRYLFNYFGDQPMGRDNRYVAENGLITSVSAYYCTDSSCDGGIALGSQDNFNDGGYLPHVYSSRNDVFSNSMGMIFTRVAATPEPGSWALMILGFGIIGGTLRGQKRAKDRSALRASAV